MLEKGHVRLHVLGCPLVHRGERMVRLWAAAVVLEEQVLRHGGSPGVVGRVCRGWAGLYLVSGAGQSFSTWNHSSGSNDRVTRRKVPGALDTRGIRGRDSAGRAVRTQLASVRNRRSPCLGSRGLGCVAAATGCAIERCGHAHLEERELFPLIEETVPELEPGGARDATSKCPESVAPARGCSGDQRRPNFSGAS